MSLRGTNQEFGRPYNRRIVLEIHPPPSHRPRAAILRGRVGLTVQTVSTIVRELEEQGYHPVAAASEPERPRLPPTTLRINPDGGYAVGIHVTPLGIDAGADQSQRRRGRRHASRRAQRDARRGPSR